MPRRRLAAHDDSARRSRAAAIPHREAIRDHLVGAIDTTRNGDAVSIATFYLSDRKIMQLAAELRVARREGAADPRSEQGCIRTREDGVPNRPVAAELVRRSEERSRCGGIDTHGEQFHTKLALVTHGDRLIVSLGSANLTRRNIGNYNLEANVAAELSAKLTAGYRADQLFRPAVE